MFRRLCISTITITMLTTAPAAALPGRPPQLDRSTADSTFIVIGRLETIKHEIGATTLSAAELKNRFGLVLAGTEIKAKISHGVIRVDEILKGSGQLGAVGFNFIEPGEFIGWATPMERTYGVFFLKHASTGNLEVTDPYFPMVPTQPGVYGRGDSPLSRIIDILGSILADTYSNAETKGLAMFWLQSSDNGIARTALRKGLTNPDLALSLYAASALMMKGDAAGITVIKNAFLPGRPLPDNLEITVPNTLRDVPDAALIPDFEELLAAPSVYMRRGAAVALQRLRTPAAGKGLRKALEDSDFEVRFAAAVGLGNLEGNAEWVPSKDQFRSNEAKYLGHWNRNEGQ
jgi:hypothetical protein